MVLLKGVNLWFCVTVPSSLKAQMPGFIIFEVLYLLVLILSPWVLKTCGFCVYNSLKTYFVTTYLSFSKCNLFFFWILIISQKCFNNKALFVMLHWFVCVWNIVIVLHRVYFDKVSFCINYTYFLIYLFEHLWLFPHPNKSLFLVKAWLLLQLWTIRRMHVSFFYNLFHFMEWGKNIYIYDNETNDGDFFSNMVPFTVRKEERNTSPCIFSS